MYKLDLEAAYWNFDARRNGYGQYKDAPYSERDAFKAAIRQMLAGADGESDIRAYLGEDEEWDKCVCGHNLKHRDMHYRSMHRSVCPGRRVT